MPWEAPSFVEVKMDAEIGSYQDDFENVPDVTGHMEHAAAQVNEQSVSPWAAIPPAPRAT